MRIETGPPQGPNCWQFYQGKSAILLTIRFNSSGQSSSPIGSGESGTPKLVRPEVDAIAYTVSVVCELEQGTLKDSPDCAGRIPPARQGEHHVRQFNDG